MQAVCITPTPYCAPPAQLAALLNAKSEKLRELREQVAELKGGGGGRGGDGDASEAYRDVAMQDAGDEAGPSGAAGTMHAAEDKGKGGSAGTGERGGWDAETDSGSDDAGPYASPERD